MDQEIVVRARDGDQRAFVALTAADYPRLFRLAFGILCDHQAAEDATQQAYLDIWRNIRRLREPAKFEGWSYRLLVHVCYAEVLDIPLGEGVGDTMQEAVGAALEALGEPYASDMAEIVQD